MGAAARQSAERYAWPRVADRVTAVYERAIEAPEPTGALERAAHWAGIRPADGLPPQPTAAAPLARPRPRPARQAQAQDRPPRRPRRRRRHRRRPDRPGGAEDRRRQRGRKHRPLRPHLGAGRLRADGALALLPRRLLVLDRARGAAAAPVRRRDVTSATMIGVLMSATLPARLGEPARAMSLARRIGRMRETFPVLLGTLVSQTRAQPRRPGDARRDHRLQHRPLPLQHPEALRLQLRAAAAAARRPARARR